MQRPEEAAPPGARGAQGCHVGGRHLGGPGRLVRRCGTRGEAHLIEQGRQLVDGRPVAGCALPDRAVAALAVGPALPAVAAPARSGVGEGLPGLPGHLGGRQIVADRSAGEPQRVGDLLPGAGDPLRRDRPGRAGRGSAQRRIASSVQQQRPDQQQQAAAPPATSTGVDTPPPLGRPAGAADRRR